MVLHIIYLLEPLNKNGITHVFNNILLNYLELLNKNGTTHY